MAQPPSREPDLVGPQADPTDEFLRLACLTYGADDPARPHNAAAMLSAQPRLGAGDVFVAAARADGPELRRLLAGDAGLATAEGGPFGWPPLLYLAYARHDPDLTAEAVADAVAALLEAGADPDSGYLWHGEYLFTALTGAFGEGEGGPGTQPAHPQWETLARALLEAGANPNDAQTLYNRMFRPDDRHLELLFEHGLDDPGELVAQLGWAVVHGMDGRVELLLRHGVGPDTEVGGVFNVARRSAYAAALASGRRSTAELLREHGARTDDVSVEDRVVGAVLAGEPFDASSVAVAIESRPALVAWAAEQGNLDAVRRAAELGWDVNRKGRIDVPSDQEWETGLHAAAGNGDVALVRLLLDLGADPAIKDCRFDATPLQWAEHFGKVEAAALLREVSDRSG